MLDFNELKGGVRIIYENEPWQIIESQHVKVAQRRPVRQIKMRNLISGRIIRTTFHQGESFPEAELESRKIKFLYHHRGQYCFVYEDKPQERFFLNDKSLGGQKWFLIPGRIYEGIIFNNKIINLNLPPKIALKVIESPPGIRGDSEKNTTKEITLETGLKIKVPLFIKQGEMIIVNTETLEYAGRHS